MAVATVSILNSQRSPAGVVEVGEVRVDGRGSDTATVAATLSLDGERFEHTFEVRTREKRSGSSIPGS